MNNDRLKFRVWVNKDVPELRLKKGWLAPQCEWVHLCNDGEIEWGLDDEPQEPILNGREVTVEFCIGIKDSKDRLIFEGDIVNYNDREYTIIYDVDGVYGTHISSECIICIYSEDLNKAKIAGNIHETEEK